MASNPSNNIGFVGSIKKLFKRPEPAKRVTYHDLFDLLALPPTDPRPRGNDDGPSHCLPDVMARDLTALREYHEQHKHREMQLVPRFLAWSSTPSSDTLFCVGNETDGRPGECSPLSWNCGSIFQQHRLLPRNYPLIFLCHQHLERHDRLVGAAGMLRSLITQLLVSYGDDHSLHFIGHEEEWMIRCHRVRALLWLFEWLVDNLRRRCTIWCLIDDVSCVEDQEEMSQVIRIIYECIARTKNTRVTFKLLVIIPNQITAGEWYRWIEKADFSAVRPVTSFRGLAERAVIATGQSVMFAFRGSGQFMVDSVTPSRPRPHHRSSIARPRLEQIVEEVGKA